MADPALIDALPLARAASEGLCVTDVLDHLLAVQDLDTSITQLQHRRSRAASRRVGLPQWRRSCARSRPRRPTPRRDVAC